MFRSPTAPGLRRFLGSSVAALLAANAMAVLTLGSDDGGSPVRRGSDTVPAAVDGVADPRVDPAAPVLITTEDGESYLADPGTEEGRSAIEDATRHGGEIRAITRPPGNGASTRSDGTVATSADQLRTFLDQLGRGGGTTTGGSSGGGSPTTSGSGGPGGLLPIDPRLVEDLLRDPLTTVTSLVQTVPSTLTSVVQTAPGTITSVVSSTPSTITSTVTSVVQTLPTLPPPTTPTTTGGLVSGLSSTVTTVVGTVTSTASTVAPAPTTPPTTSCPLLVLC